MDELTIFEGKVPAQQMREAVIRLQETLLQMPQAEATTLHKFLPGIYERTIILKPWTVLTGAAHKTPYKVRLERGVIAVNTEDGIKVLIAPCEFDAPAGSQRAGRVYEEEVVWTDIYENPDNCRNIDELESRLYVVPDIGLGDSSVRLNIKNAQIDYELFLLQIGMSKEDVENISKIEHDIIEMPDGYAVELRNSMIHGKGLFALKDFSKGDLICPGRLKGKRTPAGRYLNHSCNANVMPVSIDDDIYAIALKNICANDELLVDYRASMRVNFGIQLSGEILCQDGSQRQL